MKKPSLSAVLSPLVKAEKVPRLDDLKVRLFATIKTVKLIPDSVEVPNVDDVRR
jgi:hypothetical protein